MMEWWNSGRWYFFGLRRFLQNFAGVTEQPPTRRYYTASSFLDVLECCAASTPVVVGG